jgi:hypothetical protein
MASLSAQTNITVSNPSVLSILQGNYNPSIYASSNVINFPDSISLGIWRDISPDSIKANIIQLSTFKNRNSGSDTMSSTEGIGAARTWVYQKFQEYSLQQENRLVPFYLQFDRTICSITKHKNICAVLPGSDTSDKRIIII